jgi:hypothetical protein
MALQLKSAQWYHIKNNFPVVPEHMDAACLAFMQSTNIAKVCTPSGRGSSRVATADGIKLFAADLRPVQLLQNGRNFKPGRDLGDVQ